MQAASSSSGSSPRASGTRKASSNGSASRSSNGSASRSSSSRSSKASSNSTSHALSDVKSDVNALRTDAGRLVHGLEEAAVEKANALAGRSRDEIMAAHEQVKEFVGQRPITSLVIALGVGAIISRLMR